MGYQKAIAEKIIERKADYILMLKDNQGELRCYNEKSKTVKLQGKRRRKYKYGQENGIGNAR